MSSATHSASRAIPALPGAHHSFVSNAGSGDLPRQSVFAATGTEQEDVHWECSQMEGCRLSRDGLARQGPAATTRLFLCGYVPRRRFARGQTLRKRRKRPILNLDMPAENLINAPEFTVSELSSALKRTVEDDYRPCPRARRDFRLPRAALLRALLFRVEGRERQDRGGDLEIRPRPDALQAAGRARGDRHRQAHDLSRAHRNTRS